MILNYKDLSSVPEIFQRLVRKLGALAFAQRPIALSYLGFVALDFRLRLLLWFS
jgi:hypothetical protein